MTDKILSNAIAQSIRQLKGNDKCCDCGKFYPQWVSVTFGILICLECAGQHRSLGVQLSYVKSLTMDSWSAKHTDLVLNGGNEKWQSVCAAAGLEGKPIGEKYDNGIAAEYREKLQEDGFCASVFIAESGQCLRCGNRSGLGSRCEECGDLEGSETTSCGSSPDDGDSRIRKASASDSIMVRCTLCQTSIRMSTLDVHSRDCEISQKWMVKDVYTVDLGDLDGPLGLTFSKLADGTAYVSKIQDGGDAYKKKVVLGSVLVALGDHEISQFDVLMRKAPKMKRPIRFTFRPSLNLPTTKDGNNHQIVSFTNKDIGLAVENSLDHLTICKIETGGEADRNGVLLGSCVVQINGQTNMSVEEFQSIVKAAPRPLDIEFKRVETLMREWNENRK